MKKTLLTSLFCAAMIVSAAGSVKPNETSNKEQINNAIIDAPKLKKQNLNAIGINNSSNDIPQANFTQMIENATTNSTGKISTESSFGNVAESLINYSGTVGETNGGIAEHVGDIDLSAQVDLGKYEHIITRPDITGPIFDPNPGEGGSGNSNSGPSLNTFSDDELGYDDFSYYAQTVDGQGKIVASLKNHSSSEIEYLKNVGFASTVDKDWFRFSVTEISNYSFSFSAPNSGYYFDLYRFSETKFGGLHANDQTHTLVKTSRNDGNSISNVRLEPATYFLCVSALSTGYINTNYCYELTYTFEKNTEGTESVTFNQQTLSQYPVVIWEHDKKPYQIDRWKGEKQMMMVYQPYYNGVHNVFEGYIDPIFTENQNWRPSYSDAGFECHNLYLDSVTYLNTNEAIQQFVNVVDGMRAQLSAQALIDEKNNYIESLKIKEEKMWDAGTGTFKFIISPYLDLLEEVPYIGPFVKLGRYVIDGIEVAQAIKDALEYEVIDYDMYSATPYHLGSNLRELSTDAHLILDGYMPNHILRIPRYSYLHCSKPNYYESEFGETVGSPKVFYWVSTSMISVEYPTYHFLQAKNTTVYASQGDSVISGGYIHFNGRFKKFTSLSSYAQYTNQNPNPRSGRLMNYGIYQSGSQYYMVVNNPTNMAHLFTYNTEAQVNENQSKLFNFKANSYASELVSTNRNVTVCLNNRSYAWVRENWNDYVMKVSLKNGVTVIEGDNQKDNNVDDTFYEFGMDYLKLSIVKKNGITPWGSWVIRIRNLTTTNLNNVYYNSFMCFDADASYWSGLNDINSTSILYNGYQDVTIKENWAATTIAVSYVLNGRRYVSYANVLNSNGNTLSYHTALVRA